MSTTLNLRDGVLRIQDATAVTPNEFTVALDEGDLNLDIPGRETKLILDRGEADHARLGSFRPMSWSFTAKFQGVVAAAGDSLYDVLAGLASAWDLSAVTGASYDLADGGDAKFLQLFFDIVEPGGNTETIEIPNVPLPEVSIREGDEYNTIAASGQSYQERPITSEA